MCIYEIINTTNGYKYVGSTLKGFDWRKRKHLRELKNHKHHNRHLQNAFDLYGESSFEFRIIEEISDKSFLIEKEQEWIKKINPEYNVMRDIKSHIGVKRSKETCEKISKALTGRHLSDEAKEKLRICNLGKKQNQETKLKRAKSHYKPIIQLDLNNNLVKEWISATEAQNIGNFNRKCIYRCLWGLRPHYKGFKWQYKPA